MKVESVLLGVHTKEGICLPVVSRYFCLWCCCKRDDEVYINHLSECMIYIYNNNNELCCFTCNVNTVTHVM